MGTTVGLLLAILSLGPEDAAEPARTSGAATTGGLPQTSPAPPASAAPANGASVVGAADPLALRPRKVTDLQGVEQLSRLDVELRRRYDGLASRRTGARLALGGAVVGSTVAGVLVLVERFRTGLGGDLACAPVNTTSGQTGLTCRSASPNYAPALITLGVSAVLAGVGLALLPRDPDVAGVVALWNRRHPEAPVEGPAPAVATTRASAAEPSSGVYTPPGW